MDTQRLPKVFLQTVDQVAQVPIPETRFALAILTHTGFHTERPYQDFWVTIDGEVVATYIQMQASQPPNVSAEDVIKHVRQICRQRELPIFDYGTLNVTEMLRCSTPGDGSSGWEDGEVRRIAQTFFGMKAPDLSDAIDAVTPRLKARASHPMN
jgi:hypothetical protein